VLTVSKSRKNGAEKKKAFSAKLRFPNCGRGLLDRGFLQGVLTDGVLPAHHFPEVTLCLCQKAAMLTPGRTSPAWNTSNLREEIIYDTYFIINNANINYYCQCQGDSRDDETIKNAENEDRC
jgi:hypothetical protein